MNTPAALARRRALITIAPQLVVLASLAHGAGRDVPGGLDLPRVECVTAVPLHEHPIATAVLQALGVRLEQNGIHVALAPGASVTSGDCLGVKVSSGEFEVRFGHSEFAIDQEGVALEIGIEHIAMTGIDIKVKSLASLCDWGGVFEVGGSASDVKLRMRFAPRVWLNDCGVVSLGDFSARVTIGNLNLKPLQNDLDRLLKNLIEDGITNTLNLLFPDMLSDMLGNVLAVDLCQTKLILYQAYMAALGAGVELHAFPEETVAQLQPLYPTVDLSAVRFGYRWQPERNNTTDCNRIYFSDAGTVARLRNGLDLDAAEWSLLFHELQHTEQCAQLGGRDNYARRWFRDLEIAALLTNLADPIAYLWQIHDNMPMEQEADARASEIVVIEGTVRDAATGEPVSGLRVGAYVAGTPVRGFGTPVTSDTTGAGGRGSPRVGSFALPVEAGSHDLYVWPEGSRIQRLAVEDVDAAPGDGVIQVTIEVDANGVPLIGPAAEPTFVRGDVNASNDLNIADAVFTLSWLFSSGTAPVCEDAADANDDGRIDISDPLATLGFLFLGGVTLPPPAGVPGTDPTADSLGCAASAA